MFDRFVFSVIITLSFFWGLSQLDRYGFLAVVWLYLGSIFWLLYPFYKGWIKW
jgi:hypothetical protein